MANDWNNVKPVGCKPWLVLPAVYSDALSYGDQIAHFCAALNKLIQNNNTLPEYIQQMIQDYINGDVIGEVVQNIVSQFILNVKYPPENLKPAVGDGSADDTEAIQGCINYAKNHNGMAVYIPSGAYSVQSLTLPGDVSLFGFDRYTTKLVLRGGATTPMISSAGTGFSIIGLTLDGNAGVQVENINILSLISQDVLLRDLIVQNGYKLLVYNGTGGHLQVNNVVFGSAVYDCVEISGGSIVQLDNCQFTALSQVSGQHVIDISSDDGVYEFVNSTICPVCCVVSGNDNNIKFSSTGAITNFTDTGLRNNILVYGQEMKWYLADDLDATIENSVGVNIHGNYSKNISGNYSKNISGAYTSVKDSTENETVAGASTKEYDSSQTEIVVTKKTISATDMFLDITNPLQYKAPQEINDFFKFVQFKDPNENVYDVLVKGDKTLNHFVNVKDFGAIGDGITDDTNAFQSALDSGYNVFVPFQNNELYLLTETINFSKSHQYLFSLPADLGSLAVKTETSSGRGYIISSANVAIRSQYAGTAIVNINVSSNINSGGTRNGTGIQIITSGLEDSDCYIYGCYIYGFVNGIDFTGRGFTCYGNSMTYNENSIVLSFTSDGSGGNIYQQPLTGYRAINIQFNRFHATTICITNKTGVINGGIIANNLNDNGFRFIYDIGGMVYTNIVNNTITFAYQSSTIYTTAETFNHNNISNNIIVGDYAANRYPAHAIHITNDSDHLTISNNLIKYFNREGIIFFGESSNLILTGNNISNTNLQSTTTYGVIRFNDINGAVVSDNSLFSDNTTTAFNFSAGTITISNAEFKGNISNLPLYNNFVYGNSPIALEHYLANSAPTTGTWKVGDIIYKSNPTDFIGWVCTAAGTPGTWKTFGAVSQ